MITGGADGEGTRRSSRCAAACTHSSRLGPCPSEHVGPTGLVLRSSPQQLAIFTRRCTIPSPSYTLPLTNNDKWKHVLSVLKREEINSRLTVLLLCWSAGCWDNGKGNTKVPGKRPAHRVRTGPGPASYTAFRAQLQTRAAEVQPVGRDRFPRVFARNSEETARSWSRRNRRRSRGRRSVGVACGPASSHVVTALCVSSWQAVLPQYRLVQDTVTIRRTKSLYLHQQTRRGSGHV